MAFCYKEFSFWIYTQVDNLVYLFARSAMTKYHRLGSLNNRNLLSHGTWIQKSKIKVLEDFVSSEAFLLGLQMTAFLLSLHMIFSQWAHVPGVFSSSYKDTNPIGL